MLNHLTEDCGTFVSDVFISQGTSNVSVTKILTYTAADGEQQVYPNPATRLRIESNYDATVNVKKDTGKVYGYPVINPDSEEYTPLQVIVSVHPSNAGWKLASSDFDLGDEENTVHYGNAVLSFDVPKPQESGHLLHNIHLLPEHGNCEPQTLSFWSVKYSDSVLAPVYWWDFNGETMTDKAGGVTLAPVAENTVTQFTEGAVKNCWRASYNSVGDTNTNFFKGQCDLSEWGTKGYSLSCFISPERGMTFGFIDQERGTGNNGHCFGFQTSWYTINPQVPIGNGVKQLLTTRGEWSHLAMTISKYLDPKANDYTPQKGEGWTTDSEPGAQYGTYTYHCDAMNYASTFQEQNGKLADKYAFQVIKTYINGELKEAKLIWLSEWQQSQAGGVPGNGMFQIWAFNTSEQAGLKPDMLDEIKVFDKELSLAEIIGEYALIGGSVEQAEIKFEKKDCSPRNRSGKPADIASVPVEPVMKTFLLDNRTIAVACNYYDFFKNRMLLEFPDIRYAAYNYVHGFDALWKFEFFYRYNLWDLYRDYVPLIVSRTDDADSWKVDGNDVELIGRWQNSSGVMRFAPFQWGVEGDSTYVQPFPVDCDCADLNHFVYLRLAEPMSEGSTHTVNFGVYSKTFTYSRDHYVSSIKVNQEGYLPEAGKKYAYFGSWLGTGGAYQHSLNDLTFHIVPSSSNTPVFTGTMTRATATDTHTANGKVFPLTGEKTYVCDFSSFQSEGEYQVYIPGVGYSHKFKISRSALGKAFWTHCRGLFHHRSGCDQVKAPYTKWEYKGAAHCWTWENKFLCDDYAYGDGSCTTGSGTTYKTVFGEQFSMISNNYTGRIFRDVYGGWFDAADFDRRTYHFHAVNDLVEAYLLFPENFADNQLDLPESGNGIPDILSEAEWGLRHLRAGQQENGGIAAWIETDSHEKDWPWLSEKKYCIGVANRRDSLRYAIAAGRFARALRIAGTPQALAKAEIYAESAIRAFNFGVNPVNGANFRFSQNNASNTNFEFSYTENADRADCFIAWAGAVMYTLTKDPRFIDHVTPENWQKYIALLDNENEFGRNTASEFLFDLNEELPEFSNELKSFVVNKADAWINNQNLHTYHEMNWPPDHPYFTHQSWGCGVHPESRGRLYVYAWKLTSDTKYRDNLLLALDNITGCNAMGRCLTTGLGKVNPVRHLDSWLPRAEVELGVYEPVPGITPYTFTRGMSGGATPYGFCLYKDSRWDMNFTGMQLNILPGGLSQTVTGTRGEVATWLEQNWPVWRNHFEMEDYTVSQSEFTIWETVSGKAFLCGCLMGTGFVPDQAWKNRQPSTDKYAVEGRIYLP